MMNRRGFISALGIGTIASAVPVVTAIALSKKAAAAAKPPKKRIPCNTPGLIGSSYYSDHIYFTSQDSKCAIAVGEDGHLWVKPHEEGDWKRLMVES